MRDRCFGKPFSHLTHLISITTASLLSVAIIMALSIVARHLVFSDGYQTDFTVLLHSERSNFLKLSSFFGAFRDQTGRRFKFDFHKVESSAPPTQ